MLNSINFNALNQLKEKVDIVKIISEFVKLQRRGNNYIGLCPFHADNNPSLVVSPKKKIFKCFVCDTKGNVFTFVQKYKKISFIEAVKYVAIASGFDYRTIINADPTNQPANRLLGLLKQASEWYKGFLFNKENKLTLDYLLNRGIDIDTIKHFNFGYAPKDNILFKMCTNFNNMFGENRNKEIVWTPKEMLDCGLAILTKDGEFFDFFSQRIIIPIYDIQGNVVGFSGRSINDDVQPKYLNSLTTKLFNKSNILYNLNNIINDKNDTLIVVEGFMDVIAYHRSGYKNVVGLMGTFITPNHIDIINTIGIKHIIMSLDNDQAGIDATIRNGIFLIENGFSVSVAATGNLQQKDVDEIYQKEGVGAIKQVIAKAEDFFTYYIRHYLVNNNQQFKLNELVEKIIHTLISYAKVTSIMTTKYLELISQITKIPIKDIERKYEIDFQKYMAEIKLSISPTAEETTSDTKSENKKNKASIDLQKIEEKIDSLIYVITKFKQISQEDLARLGLIFNTSSIVIKQQQKDILLTIHSYDEFDQDAICDIVGEVDKKRKDQCLKYFKTINANYLDYFTDQPQTKVTQTINNILNLISMHLTKEFTKLFKDADSTEEKDKYKESIKKAKKMFIKT